MSTLRTLLPGIGLLAAGTLHAQLPTFAFARQFGGVQPGNGDDSAVRAAYAPDGSIYVVGNFYGAFDLDPGSTSAPVTSAGDADIYVVKLNSVGDLLWGKRVGGTGTDGARDVTVAANGDLIITGRFDGTVDFNPNAGTLNIGVGASGQYGFVWRLSGAGNTVWAKFWRGSGAGVSVDEAPDGSIHVAGSFLGTINGAVTNELALNMTSLGDRDACFFKLTSNGVLLWAGRVGGAPENDYAHVIRATTDGVVVGGDFSPGGFGSVVDFNPGPGTVNRQGIGNSDGYVLKLDEDGNYVWVDILGSLQPDHLYGMDVDADDNIWITGIFRDVMDANPGTGVNNLTSAGNDDGFLIKLNNTGGYLWSGRVGGTVVDNSTNVLVGADDGVYVTGSFYGTADFDPTNGTSNLNSSGTNDGFVYKVNTDGTFAWARRVGGPQSDGISGIDVSATGGVVLTGSFRGNVDLDPNAGESFFDTEDLADGDAFLIKLDQCDHQYADLTVTACGSYTIGGQTFTETGDHVVNLLSTANCDSTVFLVLTIQDGVVGSTTTVSNCGAYTWNGTTYTTSGTYTATFTTTAGCDSTATLQLTIGQPTSSTTTVSNCGAYTWNGSTYATSGTYTAALTNAAGCDSTATLQLTIGQPTSSTTTVSNCGAYTWNGSTYAASGTYTTALTNAAGCDSTATLQLTVVDLDASVQVEDPVLTAVLSGASYQWIDCLQGNTPITGATAQSFVAPQNGSYAVIITDQGCTITSDCFSIISTNLTEVTGPAWRLFPVPASDHLIIEGTMGNERIQLIDVQGRTVLELRSSDERTPMELGGVAPGTYHVRSIGPFGTRLARVAVR